MADERIAATWRERRRRRRFQRSPKPLLQEVADWGYPRLLAPIELGPDTSWFRFGDDVVFWVHRSATRLYVHICARPKARFAFDVRRWLAVLDFLADLEGVEGIEASDCTGTGEVAHYLERLGWEKQPDGTTFVRWTE